MQETVQSCRSDRVIGHDLRPLAEWLVGRNHDRSVLVTRIDQLKQQVSLLGRVVLVADFVDHEDVRFLEPGEFPLQAVLTYTDFHGHMHLEYSDARD